MQARIQQQLVADVRLSYHVPTLPASLAPARLWGALQTSIGKTRCRMFHRSISRPVMGKYRCWTCLHEFKTNW
ncbi:MAG TPA: hypothetical protein VLY24_27055 [Bryobacteraceae bacterium]|nr:hypothetical protein [Bryobacteraceae bacterium]